MAVKGYRKEPYIQKVCPECGTAFEIPPWAERKRKKTWCTRSCHARWLARTRKTTTGRYQTTDGYILLYRPGHPMATQAGYVFEHRLVAAETIGRLLLASEVVNHKNGIKNDNRPENLEVMLKGQHDSYGWTDQHWQVKCPCCGESFPLRGNVRRVTAP